MKDNLRGALVRLVAFVAMCALALVATLMVFAQLRFQESTTYSAEFTDISGLENGNFVRIAGVEVGKVKDVWLKGDNTAVVKFSTDNSVVVTEGTRAAIRYDNLIGGRYLELLAGPGGVKRLSPDQSIPVDRTQPALDLDALIGGFRPLFRAMSPEQVNALSGQLIQAFQDQGVTISSFLAQTADLTSTLADRDQLIGEVVVNLKSVLGSFSAQSKQFDNAVASLSELVKVLADRKTDISNAVAYTNETARTVADLLGQARQPLQSVVHETDRTAAIVDADHDYMDNLLEKLPEKYKILSRLGLFGDFFSFYLCNVVLKLNGKGGNPVYVKVAGQSSGRCTPS